MNVIEFNHVWKKFKKGEKFNSLRDAIPNFFRGANGLAKEEFWALNDISFAIEKGEIVGIIGPNGAGKSTILKLLSRILRPNKGGITINGRLSALIEVAAGFHNDLTGRENIYLNGTILGMTKKEIASKFDQIVDFSGLAEFIDTPVKRYSSGMYARLGFSVAAHMDPDILLVDEVLAVGDMAFQAKCAQKMRELLSTGATIVLVSHNLSLIQSLCKRVILLNKGEIAKDGIPEQIIPYYQDIVYKQQMLELNKKNTQDNYRVSLSRESPLEIINVLISDGTPRTKDEFFLGEPILIIIQYEAKKRIKQPLFSLQIIRSDGVICCASDTKEFVPTIEEISGKGEISASLGKINLAPGIYTIRISVLDKDILHPYAIRKQDILRITTDGIDSHPNVVFLPKISWQLNK